MRILGTLPETCSEEEMRNTGRQDLAIFVCWLVSKSLQEMLVTTDLFVKNAGFQVPSLLVQPVWGLPRNTAYPGYSNNNGPNLDENWPKARFQSHWEESLRKGAGHNCTAHLWPHREQRRGTQAPRRAGLQQLQAHLLHQQTRLSWGRPGGGKPRALTAGKSALTRTDPDANGPCPFLFYLFFIGE